MGTQTQLATGHKALREALTLSNEYHADDMVKLLELSKENDQLSLLIYNLLIANQEDIKHNRTSSAGSDQLKEQVKQAFLGVAEKNEIPVENLVWAKILMHLLDQMPMLFGNDLLIPGYQNYE